MENGSFWHIFIDLVKFRYMRNKFYFFRINNDKNKNAKMKKKKHFPNLHDSYYLCSYYYFVPSLATIREY